MKVARLLQQLLLLHTTRNIRTNRMHRVDRRVMTIIAQRVKHRLEHVLSLQVQIRLSNGTAMNA
jgi:hypothetical protein